jgi:type II secretory pathway component PulC
MWTRSAQFARQAVLRGPWIATSLLAVAIGLDVTRFILQGERGTDLRRSEMAAPGLRIPSQRKPPDVAAIVSAHLFGTATSDTVDSTAAVLVPLNLTGTIVAQGGAQSYALIGEPGRSQMYRQGDPLAGGGRVQEIYPDHVVVLRNSIAEVLALPRAGDAPSGMAGRPSPRRATMVLAEAEADGSPAGDEAEAPISPPPLAPSGAVARALNLRPAIEHGQRVGMRVMGSAAGAKVLASLGLSAGDIVVDINGEPVGVGAAGPGIGGLMNTINEGQTATLGVQRDGQAIEVTIDAIRAETIANLYSPGR